MQFDSKKTVAACLVGVMLGSMIAPKSAIAFAGADASAIITYIGSVFVPWMGRQLDGNAEVVQSEVRNASDVQRKTMEAMGFSFVLARSTAEALAALAAGDFAAIISDMGRKEGPKEGYVLLEAVRATDQRTPFFIYASSRAPEHRREAALRGAQGATNLAAELVEMVVHGVRRSA